MALNRRDLLKQVALSTVALGARLGGSPYALAASTSARAIDALELKPFVDPLPLLRPTSSSGGLYRITMREIRVKMHRDLPPTRLWSYSPDAIGPLIEAQAHQEVRIEWQNQLPLKHFLPIDYHLHGSGRELPESRAVVHLHGGRTPAVDDGYPEHWFPPGKSHLSTYPNHQDAAMLWYHDHAMGISRLNLYAGLMGVYLLRDEREAQLRLPIGAYELPLVLYDRRFDHEGQLFYPVSPIPDHPWTDEVLGDAMLVNGRVQPFHAVEPRRYRLRILNAANARFFNLGLSNGATFLQIGADQGLLPAPVSLTTLLLAPGERADLLIDFAPMRGQRVTLTNGAFQMMQFRVAATQVPSNHVDAQSRIPDQLSPVARLAERTAARTREMTLNEYKDPAGNAMVMLLNRIPWHMPVTEVAKLGSTEIWSLINLTEDTHPIHLHHVRFQVIDRRPFDPEIYLMEKGKLHLTGAAVAPHPNELGWKDVVQCPPSVVTRIHISFHGYPGRYLWHCHVQEHEANDMMRPYEIIA
jgi:spore coat protein A, manganese oxidase